LRTTKQASGCATAAEWDSWTLRINDTIVTPHRQTSDFDELCKTKRVNPELTFIIWTGLNELTAAKQKQFDDLEKRRAGGAHR
jgi:hypothetical protein